MVHYFGKSFRVVPIVRQFYPYDNISREISCNQCIEITYCMLICFRDVTDTERLFTVLGPVEPGALLRICLGYLANRWRVFCSTIALSPEFVSDLAFATLVLHNFLRSGQSRQIYCPKHLVDEEDPLSGQLIPGS